MEFDQNLNDGSHYSVALYDIDDDRIAVYDSEESVLLYLFAPYERIELGSFEKFLEYLEEFSSSYSKFDVKMHFARGSDLTAIFESSKSKIYHYRWGYSGYREANEKMMRYIIHSVFQSADIKISQKLRTVSKDGNDWRDRTIMTFLRSKSRLKKRFSKKTTSTVDIDWFVND